ncbi:hypothetical protein STEG23_036555 [Scotinomys teguina]
MCWLSWFLDPGGWSKTTVVGLYFIFPGICTLFLDQDCRLKNREPDMLALLVPGSWKLEQDRCGWTVLYLPWNLYPVPLIVSFALQKLLSFM